MNPMQETKKSKEEGEGEMSKKTWSLKKLMMSLKSKKKMDGHSHTWKSLMQFMMINSSSTFRWKRVKTIHRSFFDNVVFKIVSVCEGVVLVSTVCFFFLCCGCHF